MKKFKHKKTGEIATYKNGVLKIERCCVEIGVEPSSEFWEEIVEKDYEILSFINNSDPAIWKNTPATLRADGKYRINDDSDGWTLDCLLSVGVSVKSGHLKIHSVKRLNDGEVFTVGDEVKSIHWTKGSSIIESFEIKDGKLRILEKGQNSDTSKWLSLECICKIKKSVLFTTEDGVDIYEGDIVHQVNKNFEYYSYYWGIQHGNKGVPFENFKMFSTKEKAEEFIILNKPCLSINDVNNCYLSPKLSPLHNNLTNNLKELVKSKL